MKSSAWFVVATLALGCSKKEKVVIQPKPEQKDTRDWSIPSTPHPEPRPDLPRGIYGGK